MKLNSRYVYYAYPEHGAALITGLIFMVILTLLAISAARMAGLEERMSGNMRDRSIAMQAAEMALRDAEQDILGVGSTRTPPISGTLNFLAACTNGLCYNGPTGYPSPVWTTVSMTASPSVEYGDYTGAVQIPGLSAQPRYIIEGINKYCWKKCGSSTSPGYRITVRAQGANESTVVWLQEVFKP